MPTPDSIGRYPVIRLLGTGGFALVWLGRDERLDDQIAIKVLAENWSERMDVRARFEHEAKVLRRTNSHRVVEVYDIDETPDGRPYFVMTYADRGSLADALRLERLPVRQALRYGAEIAGGIHDLHEAGVLHRDVKPSNVLLRSAADGSTRVLVADLGLARDIDRGSRFTLAAGTVGYMAPEQGDPERTIGPPVDIYGVGASVYFALTGRAPTGAVPPSALRSGLSDEVDAVLLRALDPDPGRRWPSARALEEALHELSEQAEPESAGDPEATVIGPGAVTGEVATVQHVEDPFAGKEIVPEGPEPEPARRRWVPVAVLVLVAVVAAGVVLYLRVRGGESAGLVAATTSSRPVPTTGSAAPSTSSTSAVPSSVPATVTVTTAAAVAPPPVAPTSAVPNKPLPGQLIRCAVIDGRDYFECLVFSRGNTGYALDFYSDSYHVVMWEKKPAGDPYAWSQHWQFWWIEAKSAYMLYNPASARCLTMDGDGSVGSQSHATPCDPNSQNQLWNWTDTTSWILRNRLGNCLDVPRAEYRDGAAPFGYTCNGNDNQRWLLRPI